MQKHTKPLLDKKTAKYYFLRYTIATLYTLAVVYLLLFKVPSTEKLGFLNFVHSDKIIHFIICGILFMLWVLSPSLLNQSFAKRNLIIATLCFLFSILLETLQSFTNYRSFELLDLVANLSGITFFYLIQKKSKIFQVFFNQLQ